MFRTAAFVISALLLTPQSLAQIEISNESRLKDVMSRQVVRIAYRSDASPFSFVRERGHPVGYTIDLCGLVIDAIGRLRGQSLRIDWVPVTLETRFSAIADGEADMECGSSTITLRRLEQVDFSSVVFVESTAILVRRQSAFRSFSDMNGKKIAVIAGTSNESALADQMRRRKFDSASLITVGSREEGIAALESGAADGYASDKLLLIGAEKQRPATLALLPDDLSVEPYAIAMPRGDWAFRLAVNEGLSEIYKSGAQYDVFERWFDKVGLHPSAALMMAWTFGRIAD